MADAVTRTRGRLAAFASACARLRVPATRLSRILVRLALVQRLATVSPARCTTASKPVMVSGARGRAGSHGIWWGPAGVPRTSEVTSTPPAWNEKTRARPIKPDAPVTSTRAESRAMAVNVAERRIVARGFVEKFSGGENLGGASVRP